MKQYLIGAGIVILAVASFFTGQSYAPVKLGSYVPPVQSSSGFATTYATSTAIATTTFCTSGNNVQWLGFFAQATGTLVAATSSYAGCNSPNLGASYSGLIVNDSTNTVTYVAGTGVAFKCETVGVGSSTVLGGCTGSSTAIHASSTMYWTAYFDTASSDLKIAVGNAWQ